MKISIVTSTYNRSLQASRGLQSLLNQNILPDELIIVDDGSTDDTRAVSRELINKNPKVNIGYIYLDHPEHRISCIPHNVGFKQSTGDIVMFVESEILHVGNTIEQMLAKMNENPNRTPVATQVWTVQEKIYKKLSQDNFDRPSTILNHQYAQLTDSTNLNNTKAPDSDWAITGSINCLTGCFFAVERKWLEDIGGFDESFEGHGGDDFNLFDRLAAYGTGILPCNDICVIHQWHEKNYPYNIYNKAEENMRKGADLLKTGEYRANIGKNWGEL